MMNREEMLNEVIRNRGFEDEYTVKFANFIEDEAMSDEACLAMMETIVAMPCETEEDF